MAARGLAGASQRPTDTKRRGSRPSALRAAALSFAFLAVACAGQDEHPSPDYNAFRATRLFSAGYNDIADIYIDEVDVSILAVAGLKRLDSVDPDVSIERNDGLLYVEVDGDNAGAFTLPPAEDADGWGSLTAAVLDASRRRSDELGKVGAEKLYETVFDGALSRLDGFSRYAGASEARENRANRDGFGGIGVRIRLVEHGVELVSVMDDTPASRAGLEAEDVITRIEGELAAGLSQREVVRRLRGPVRSQVNLTVARAGTAQPLSIAVTRAHIVPQTVTYRPKGRVAYLRVTGFNQSTARTLRERVEEAKRRQGADLAGFVLDLRGNPGGLLDQAVAVADLFVGEGRIVSTHGRHPDSHQYFEAAPDDVADGLPVAVLVNASSASASEIVAAALQDAHRAAVIGSTSYGKGTVQTVLRLPNEGELTLTWARFHAPSGYTLNERGVLPDLCTSGELHDRDAVLQALRDGGLPLDARKVAAAASDVEARAAALRERCPLRRGSRGIDMQVAQALLEDPQLYRLATGAPAQRIAAQAESEERDHVAAHSPTCSDHQGNPTRPQASC